MKINKIPKIELKDFVFFYNLVKLKFKGKSCVGSKTAILSFTLWHYTPLCFYVSITKFQYEFVTLQTSVFKCFAYISIWVCDITYLCVSMLLMPIFQYEFVTLRNNSDKNHWSWKQNEKKMKLANVLSTSWNTQVVGQSISCLLRCAAVNSQVDTKLLFKTSFQNIFSKLFFKRPFF